MDTRTVKIRSLLGASNEEVCRWVGNYIFVSGLGVSVDQLIAEALRMEGTNRGITKTKVRKARRSLIAR